MEISVSENIRPGANYSTVFQSNKPTWGLTNPPDKEFSFAFLARTTITMTGFYSRAGNQIRVEWGVASSRGADVPIVDTPQVYDVNAKIAKKFSEANAGQSFSAVGTWLLTENVPLPKNLTDIAEAGINKVGGAVETVFEGIGKPVLILGGIV